MSQIPVFVNRFLHFQCKQIFQVQIRNRISRTFYTSFLLAEKVSFNLSDIGEGIREVVVKEWFVKEGDKVSQFDNICEVQSDKASVTITSRYDGIITKLYYQIDDIALVGKPLIDLETDEKTTNENVEEEQVKPEVNKTPTQEKIATTSITEPSFDTASESSTSSSFSSSAGPDILCIPSVRRLAKEHKIDLSKVEGSGKNGRILKEDVLRYMEEPVESTFKDDVSKSVSFEKDDNRIEPIRGFTKAMVKTMTEALKIPHFVYSDEIKVTKLSQLRNEIKNLPDLKDTKVTFLPFFIKAASNALYRYPIVNSSIDDKCENIIYHKHHNIGVAMATNQGLAVPVIKNVENLTILEIAKKLNDLIKSGKNGTFTPSDLSSATFSISNIGIVGGTYTKPVILPPQVAIIAIGMTQVLPRFDSNGNVVAEEIINISGSADHRVVDGVSMANFTKILKKHIENPNLLFLNV